MGHVLIALVHKLENLPDLSPVQRDSVFADGWGGWGNRWFDGGAIVRIDHRV
jgi:hypothetical protein